MDFPSLREAFTNHFGPDAEIDSPEAETEAWQAIVDSCREGEYPGLSSDLAKFLERSDKYIVEFLESYAPAWTCENFAEARRSVEVFYAYIQTYAPGRRRGK
jgi:hypothetical protein